MNSGDGQQILPGVAGVGRIPRFVPDKRFHPFEPGRGDPVRAEQPRLVGPEQACDGGRSGGYGKIGHSRLYASEKFSNGSQPRRRVVDRNKQHGVRDQGSGVCGGECPYAVEHLRQFQLAVWAIDAVPGGIVHRIHLDRHQIGRAQPAAHHLAR